MVKRSRGGIHEMRRTTDTPPLIQQVTTVFLHLLFFCPRQKRKGNKGNHNLLAAPRPSRHPCKICINLIPRVRHSGAITTPGHSITQPTTTTSLKSLTGGGRHSQPGVGKKKSREGPAELTGRPPSRPWSRGVMRRKTC